MDAVQHVFKGTFIHSTTRCDLEIIENHMLGTDRVGKILFFEDAQIQSRLSQKWGFDESNIQALGNNEFFMPGMIDTHIHAPQYTFIGIGMERPLLEWLEHTTFPTEDTFCDVELARNMYNTVVYDRVKPIITPRFAISCSERLLNKLGKLAEKHDLHIQSHISESPAEIKEVRRLFPDYNNYTEVYDRNKLLTNKTVMAHGCYLTNEELCVFRERGAAISHCPNSNISLCSGHLDVRNALNHRVKMGLGTDVAGGYSISLLDAIRKAIETSKIIFMERSKSERDNNETQNKQQENMKPDEVNEDTQNGPMKTENNHNVLSYKEAFWLATLGGSEALGIDHITGNFKVGKEFDALIINPEAKDSPFEVNSHVSKEEMLQRFLYLGDDRNIKSVYVAGICVVPFPSNT
ncbi:guanine deaminase isoform X3 [Rhinoderma darwinii]|uniref:guanine deaminase isoform X3 n=1 Tax=Rhinoderma darwinii TaxID=43563 RepID=UPI003F66F27B